MTPKEVLAQIRQREVTTVDLRFMDFPGRLAAFLDPGRRPDRGDLRGGHRLRRLERRRLAGDQRGRPAGRPAARDGADRPVPGAADPDDDLQHPGPDHPAGLHPRPPQHRPQGRQLHAEHRAWPIDCLLGPELEFFVFDNVRFDQRGHEAFYHVDSVEGAWNRGRAETPNLGYKPGSGLGLLPLPADRQPGRPPHRDGPAHGRVRHRHVGPLPRGRHRRPVRDRPDPAAAGRERRPGRCWPSTSSATSPAATARPRRSCPSRSSATTARACTPTSRSGRTRSAAPGRQRLRRPQRPGHLRHRRPAQARHGAVRLRQPDDQQLQAAGPRLRGADQDLATAGATARRSSAIPIYSPSPESRRIEYPRPRQSRPIPTCSSRPCSWRSSTASRTRSGPGDPLDKDIYDLQPEELDDVPTTPRSLEASLDALRADHEFLLRGDVFTPDVIDTWIWYKQTHEVETHPRPPSSLRVRALLRRLSRSRVSEIDAPTRVDRASGTLARSPPDGDRQAAVDRISVSAVRLLGPKRVEHQDERTGDEHVVGEVEDRAVEVDRDRRGSGRSRGRARSTRRS